MDLMIRWWTRRMYYLRNDKNLTSVTTKKHKRYPSVVSFLKVAYSLSSPGAWSPRRCPRVPQVLGRGHGTRLYSAIPQPGPSGHPIKRNYTTESDPRWLFAINRTVFGMWPCQYNVPAFPRSSIGH